MSAPRRELHLAGFFPFGPHYDWTAREDPEDYYDVESYAGLARSAERGLFSALFLGDSQRLREHLGRVNDTVVTGRPDQLVLFAHWPPGPGTWGSSRRSTPRSRTRSTWPRASRPWTVSRAAVSGGTS